MMVKVYRHLGSLAVVSLGKLMVNTPYIQCLGYVVNKM